MKFGARQGRATNSSPHDLARELAAQRLSLPLPAAEATWLASHLRRCPACAAIDEAYRADREDLRRLVPPEPPRDLFARTSVALDRAERAMSRHEVAGPPLPGVGGRRTATGPRTLRAIRTERHASAVRAAGLRAAMRRGWNPGPAATNPGWLMPFAGLAVLALVVVIGGTALLTQTFSPDAPITRPGGSLAAVVSGSLGVTPIPVGAADVAWLSPVSDGTYTLNSARVDRVCAATIRPDCAPFDGSEARQIPTLKSRPRAVLKSPSRQQLVVVEAGTRTGGGTVYVMSVPATVTTPAPSPSAGATAGSTADPSASGNPQPSPSGAVPPTELPTEPSMRPTLPTATTPAATSAPSNDTSAPISASPSPSPLGSPSAAGDSPSPDPSGATPSASSIPPGTPEPTAAATLAIISNVVVMGETAAYSPDGTMLAFSARPADGSHGPDIYLWRVGDPSARPVTTDHASMFSGWWGTWLIGSRADRQGQAAPVSDGSTIAPSAPDPAASDSTGASDGGADGVSNGNGSDSTSTDPSPSLSGASPSAPVVTPRASPSSAIAAPSGESVSPGASTTPEPSVTPEPATAPEAVPQSFLIDSASGVETPITSVSAWRPVVDPTGRFVVYWSGRLRYDATTLSWVPGAGQLLVAFWPAFTRSDSAAILAPTQLLPNDPDGAPSGDWDIRWDETGGHLAIWIADSTDPSVGRLSLLTIDAATATTIPAQILLHDAQALPGFSLGNERLAWATPPGQDGEGSRLQVFAWTGDNAGKIDSQPASGGGAMIVVR
jgi:WD40-like Beta Propeller Repeat